jgi:hypothetical protein
MQSYFITRGKYEEVETFITWLRCQVLPLKIIKGDGSTDQMAMECMVRPIQLWEFVYPREHHDLVVNSLNLAAKTNPFYYNSSYNLNPKLFVLRKLLGAKSFEQPKDKINKLMLPYERFKNINVLGIGYVEDGDIAELTHERI